MNINPIDQSNTPTPLQPIAKHIPVKLTQLCQWVGWKLERRDGAWTKVPYDPRVKARKAKAGDSRTWGTFEQAWAWANHNDGSGIGFQFNDNGIVGVDLDKCRDPDSGAIADWAQRIIERLKSYSEVSPSGTGVHVILCGTIPGPCRRKGSVEMYSGGRYFCVTGHHIGNTPTTIRDAADDLSEVYREVFAANDTTPSPMPNDIPQVMRGDATLIEKAKAAKNGDRFAALWNGHSTGYVSHSEADLALCSELAFWTGRNAHRIDRLFRQSGLYRPKWDRADYRKRTIETAIQGCGEVYEDKESPPKGKGVALHLTDVGNAQRFAKDHRDNLKAPNKTSCPMSV